jgi:hypothetical protein
MVLLIRSLEEKLALKIGIKKESTNPNIMVYGAPMSGKTTWVVENTDKKDTLFISTDNNAIPGCKVAEVTSWDELLEAIDFAVSKEEVKCIVLDVLDDAVAFSEQRAQKSLGMVNKVDAKGGYGKFSIATCELIKESVLRPLLMSPKRCFVVMHSATNSDGVEVPCFGMYSRDAIDIVNWLKGRSQKIVKCVSSRGVFDQIVENERKPIVVKDE